MAQPSHSTEPVFEDEKPVSIDTIIAEEKDFKGACSRLLRQYRTRGVVAVKEIYQTSSKKYVDAHTKAGTQLGFDRSGICLGMSLKWIQLGKTGQETVFQDALDTDWAFFGSVQGETTRGLAQAMTTVHTLRAKADPIRNSVVLHELGQGEFDPENVKPFDQLKNWLDCNVKKRFELYQLDRQIDVEEDRARDALKGQYEKVVYLTAQNNLPGERVKEIFKNRAITEVTANMTSFLSERAFYFMELKGDGKHGVAFSTLDAKPRFMDPNSCDFRFPSLPVMDAFLRDYFKLYFPEKWAGFGEAKCWLLRFL